MDLGKELTEEEKRFLTRAAKRKNLFLISSVLSVVVSASFLVFHGIFARDLNGLRFAIIVILLLSGRSYLRLYKSAVIFGKLNLGPMPKQR